MRENAIDRSLKDRKWEIIEPCGLRKSTQPPKWDEQKKGVGSVGGVGGDFWDTQLEILRKISFTPLNGAIGTSETGFCIH